MWASPPRSSTGSPVACGSRAVFASAARATRSAGAARRAKDASPETESAATEFAEPGPGSEPGRNEPCWCGSGRKYKKCHLDRDQAVERYQARVTAFPVIDHVAAFFGHAAEMFPDWNERVAAPGERVRKPFWGRSARAWSAARRPRPWSRGCRGHRSLACASRRYGRG
ncbi:MAG: SEC-C metal-binding domain-containing protein [Dehalococcoidia bacterium]